MQCGKGQGGFGAVAAEGIGLRWNGAGFEIVQHGGEDVPGGFEFVCPNEEAFIPLDDIEQQGFIGVRNFTGESGRIAEVQFGFAQGNPEPGHFCHDIQGDARIGLHPYKQFVGGRDAGGGGEDVGRHVAECNVDFGFPVMEAFARADEEGYAIPPAVMHLQHGGGIGGGD